MDYPNRQSLGLAAPWAEAEEPESRSENPLDEMTKQELLELGQQRGLDVNQQMAKAEIRSVIDENEE